MAKKKQKYYVVWEGMQTGIFSTWDECQRNTKGYPQAKYKSFERLAEAEEAFRQGYHFYIKASKDSSKSVSTKQLKVQNSEHQTTDTEPLLPALCVDAACSGNPGLMEYRGVWVNEDGSSYEVFRKGAFEMGTNNVGEFLALVHGLAYLDKEGTGDEIHIYSDSRTAMSWVRQKLCKTKLAKVAKNKVLFELVARGENWLREHSFKRKILKWDTKAWGEIPADFGRK